MGGIPNLTTSAHLCPVNMHGLEGGNSEYTLIFSLILPHVNFWPLGGGEGDLIFVDIRLRVKTLYSPLPVPPPVPIHVDWGGCKGGGYLPPPKTPEISP